MALYEELQGLSPEIMNAAIKEFVPALARLPEYGDPTEYIVSTMGSDADQLPVLASDLPHDLAKEYIQLGRRPSEANDIAACALIGVAIVIKAAKLQAAETPDPAESVE